jgi:rare lipoprotein A
MVYELIVYSHILFPQNGAKIGNRLCTAIRAIYEKFFKVTLSTKCRKIQHFRNTNQSQIKQTIGLFHCIIMRWLCMSILILMCCTTDKESKEEEIPYMQIGEASYYARFFSGETTASGEVYDPNEMTAAHQHLPFGTVVEVTNLDNNKSVTVTINDRGPFVGQRIIDLSRAAAEALDIVEEGVVMVEMIVVEAAEGHSVADSVARVPVNNGI